MADVQLRDRNENISTHPNVECGRCLMKPLDRRFPLTNQIKRRRMNLILIYSVTEGRGVAGVLQFSLYLVSREAGASLVPDRGAEHALSAR